MTPESQIKGQIKKYLDLKQVFWWYNLAGMGAYKGIPDIFAIKDGVIYGIEVKTPKGVLSPHQVEFQALLTKHGGLYLTARSVEDVIKLFP